MIQPSAGLEDSNVNAIRGYDIKKRGAHSTYSH